MYTILVAPGLGATKDKHLTNTYWLNKSVFLQYHVFIVYLLCTICLLLSLIWGTFTSRSYFLQRRLCYIHRCTAREGRQWVLPPPDMSEPRLTRLHDSSHNWTGERAGTSTVVLSNAPWGSCMATGHLLSLPPLPQSQQKMSCLPPGYFSGSKKELTDWRNTCTRMLRAALQ